MSQGGTMIRNIMATIAAAALVAGCSSSGGSGPSSQAIPSLPSDVVGTTAPSAANTASSDGLAAQLSAWFNSVQSDWDAIQQDETSFAGVSTPADATTVCVNLKTDVQAFQADPEAPDPVVRRDIAQAMTNYATAAQQCIDGDYTSAAGGIGQGTGWITKATARIKQIGGIS